MNEMRNTVDLVFRPARRAEVPVLVHLLSADSLGAQRETADSKDLPQSYFIAFDAIEADPHNELVVAEAGGEIAGLLQITFIPYLTYRGGWRALIEGVRVAERFRNRGAGRQMFEWAIARAREKGCHMVQLTTDRRRTDARRFYERLGFVASHEGMKLHLEQGGA